MCRLSMRLSVNLTACQSIYVSINWDINGLLTGGPGSPGNPAGPESPGTPYSIRAGNKVIINEAHLLTN